jgi:NAD(P)-dependent dehydrogenase (short-subunit alcohol dehydrogenase family)
VSLINRVAVVTGGSKGIGAAFCRGLTARGVHVAAIDVDAEAAEGLVAELTAQGAQVIALYADVADQVSLIAAFERIIARFGRIDILVNNAAVHSELLPGKPFWEINPDEWDKVMAVNVKGAFFCTKAALPYLKVSRAGRVINIASGTVWTAVPGYAHYVASKGALVAFTRALARELGQFDITVNAIAPGLTESETVRSKLTNERLTYGIQARAIQRRQAPEHLVDTLLFLASEGSALITGQTIIVDGGTIMR